MFLTPRVIEVEVVLERCEGVRSNEVGYERVIYENGIVTVGLRL